MVLKLQDLIDIEQFQLLQDRLNEIYSFPSSIIDNDGKVLTATAWQDICTKFHRQNPECEKTCIKSDQYIAAHLHEANPAVSYRCPHGLIDNATPIIIEGVHYGNFFTGQFFLEPPDLNFFRAQAKRYGFDEEAYIEAVKKVPIWTQEQLNSYLFFIKGLIEVIGGVGLKNLKEIETRKRMEESEDRHRSILQTAMDGVWLVDTQGHLLEVNDAYCRMSGYSTQELLAMRISDLEVGENADDIAAHLQKVITTWEDRFESRHRRKDGTVFDVEISVRYQPTKGGRMVAFLRDITARKKTEEELSNERNLIANIMETSPVGITTVDSMGTITFANSKAVAILGLSKDEISQITYNAPTWHISDLDGKPFPDDRLPFNIVMSTGKSVFDVQHAIQWPDGKRILLSINGAPMIDADGHMTGMVASIEDITQRKTAEENYLTLFREMIDGFALHEIICDEDGFPADYRFLDINPAFERITGLKAEELVGHAVLEIMPETERYWIETYGKVALTGEPAFFESYSVELGKHFEVTAFQPAPNQFACIFADITERKKVEEEIRRRDSKYRELVEHAQDGIFTITVQGQFLLVNTKFCQMLGYTLEECLHRNILDTYPDDIRPVGTQRLADLQTGKALRFERPMKRQDGGIVFIEAIAWKDSDGNVQAIVRDITERKQVEEEKAKLQDQLLQAQKMESVGRLAGGVAHDFNNMLGVILGHVEMAMEQVDPGQMIYADLQEIKKAAERSTDLARQLLAFARKQTVSPKVLDLNDTVGEMLKMLQRLIGEDIHLAWVPGANTWPVKVDPSQIDQVLANLCVNARDAIAGVGKVTIETGNISFDEDYCSEHAGFTVGEYALLAVSDDGCGMDKETLSKLFEPFFTTKETGKGTGLGLATVYGIVKQNEGFINVYSEPDKGTTFKIYLPRHIGKAKRVLVTGLKEPAMRGKETVLVVEDEPAILSLSRRMLEKQGYHVIAAATPGEAIRLAEAYAGEIQLLMTDVVMPEMNGRDLARKLLSFYPNLKRLFMSGYTANVIAHHGVLDEGVHFIQKPFSIKDLAAKVREAIDQK
jgi:two-component system, cell cycle sensor histidine kinase and response regulator CckA